MPPLPFRRAQLRVSLPGPADTSYLRFDGVSARLTGDSTASCLQVDRRAGEDVPAKRVIDLGIGAAVAERSPDRVRSADGRLLVEDVVRAKPQVELVPDARRQGEVEEALRVQLGGALRDLACQVRVAARRI